MFKSDSCEEVQRDWQGVTCGQSAALSRRGWGILLENVYLSLLLQFSDLMVTTNASVMRCHSFYISIIAFQLLKIYLKATFVKWSIAEIKGLKGYIKMIIYFLEWCCLCEILLKLW